MQRTCLWYLVSQLLLLTLSLAAHCEAGWLQHFVSSITGEAISKLTDTQQTAESPEQPKLTFLAVPGYCSLAICSKHWLSLETVLKAGLLLSCQ